MRAFLTTLAVMAISATAANANEMNRDPEGSIALSTVAANQPDMSSSMDASVISKMEPAAGTEVRSAIKPARIAKYQPTANPVPAANAYNHDDVEGTVVPSRIVE